MENLRGALFMILAMALFAVEDMFIKLMSVDLPTGQILVILGLGGGLVFAVMAFLRRQTLWTRALLHRIVLARTAAEVIGTVGFVTALALTDITLASAILQALPLVVTLGAAFFLGEQVGIRRWSAIAVGFAGVLLVIRPGLDAFEPASLFAVQAVIALGARDLLTRVTPRQTTAEQMSIMAFLGIAVAGGALLLTFDQSFAPVNARNATFAVATVLIGVIAYLTIVAATRTGDVGAVAPFRYSRIAFALVAGVLVFRERPDAATLIGAAIIVASGVYTLIRTRQRKGAASLPGGTGI
ncbi:DMT family transporter [Flavimaricola marinus]|uniref:Riboflavin transporter n=1 Tax=Flavimaricola marinus TaxID=1819565 RepID=A0A238LDK4_9RHOB|nr:DMT family transporter [Flavimaricola marinus]SMY07633.1 Riboflavin transporter [Flavimaricola marinus]